MKKITLSIGLALIAFFSKAQVVNGLDSIIVEKYYVSNGADAQSNSTDGVLPPGSVTYRVFASLHPGYTFQSIFGNSATPSGVHKLLISTTTTFFNNKNRGDSDVGNIQSSYLNKTSLALDSWLSVGASAQGQFGVLKSKDNGAANLIFPHNPSSMLANTEASVGIPLSVQDGMVAGSPTAITFIGDAGTNATTVFGPTAQGTKTYSITNGSVSANVYNGTLVGTKGPSIDSNRVLIGQFTTNGSFHFELFVQIGTPGSGVQRFVASNPQPAQGQGTTSVPAEILLPSLTYTSLAANLGNPPSVSITAPTNTSTYSVSSGGTLAITANAASASSIIDSVTFFVDGARVGVTTTSPYTYNWVSTSGTHTLTAVATDDNGQQSTSSSIVTSIVTGISETSSASSLSIYPNPANDVLNFEINTTQQIGNLTYAIYDVIGNVLLNKNIGSVSGIYKEVINVSSFSKGIYIVKVTSDSLTSTKKVIID
jgi:hypothetical protein